MQIPVTDDVLAKVKSEKIPLPVETSYFPVDFMFPEMTETSCVFNLQNLPRTKEHFPVCVTQAFRNTNPAGHLDGFPPTPGKNLAKNEMWQGIPSDLRKKQFSDLLEWHPNIAYQKFEDNFSVNFEQSGRSYKARPDAAYEADVRCGSDCRGYVFIKELSIQYTFYFPTIAEDRLEEVIRTINAMYAGWAHVKLSRHVAPIPYKQLEAAKPLSEVVRLAEPALPDHSVLFSTQSTKFRIPASQKKVDENSKMNFSKPEVFSGNQQTYWYPELVLSDDDAHGIRRDHNLANAKHFKVQVEWVWDYDPAKYKTINDNRLRRRTPRELTPYLAHPESGKPELVETQNANLWRWKPDLAYQQRNKDTWDAKDLYFVAKDNAPFEAYVYCPPDSGKYCIGQVFIKAAHLQYKFIAQSAGRDSMGEVIEATNAMIVGWVQK